MKRILFFLIVVFVFNGCQNSNNENKKITYDQVKDRVFNNLIQLDSIAWKCGAVWIKVDSEESFQNFHHYQFYSSTAREIYNEIELADDYRVPIIFNFYLNNFNPYFNENILVPKAEFNQLESMLLLDSIINITIDRFGDPSLPRE